MVYIMHYFKYLFFYYFKYVSGLAASAINDDRRCRSGRDRRWFGRTASPTSKAFNESHPRRL